MKSEFEARPLYLQRYDRIEAHFLTCFIALMIYRILEKSLDKKYTCEGVKRWKYNLLTKYKIPPETP